MGKDAVQQAEVLLVPHDYGDGVGWSPPGLWGQQGHCLQDCLIGVAGAAAVAGGVFHKLEICSWASVAASLLFTLGHLCVTKQLSGLSQTTGIPSCRL